MGEKIVIFGAGGHAKVVADIILKCGNEVVGFLDDCIEKGNYWQGIPVLGTIDECIKYSDSQFIIAIGNSFVRQKIATAYEQLFYATVIHPTAVLARDVIVENGTCVMANAVINVSTHIGAHCIINTAAVIEHDNQIEDFAHISPNATLAGNVTVGQRTHIGAGAIVKNNIAIAKDCVIGVGGVVVKNIEKSGVYIGVPAKEKIK